VNKTDSCNLPAAGNRNIWDPTGWIAGWLEWNVSLHLLHSPLLLLPPTLPLSGRLSLPPPLRVLHCYCGNSSLPWLTTRSAGLRPTAHSNTAPLPSPMCAQVTYYLCAKVRNAELPGLP